MLIFLVIAQVAYIVGRRILLFLKLNLLGDGILGTSVYLLFGYGVLSYFSLIFSLIGSLYKWFIWLFLATLIILDYKSIFLWYKQTYKSIKNYKTFDIIAKYLLVAIAICFIFYLTSAFVPPYRNDSLAYHLPEATQIVREGISVLWVEGSFFPNLPILMETLYALVFVSADFPDIGFIAINLTHYFILIVAMFFIYGFARELFGRRSALFSILGIFTVYELFVNATNAYVDGAMVAYEVVGLLILSLGISRNNYKILFLSGIFYGFAISIKYYALYGLMFAMLLLVFWSLKQRYNWKELFRNISVFSLGLLLASGFWYFKNLILYGNPVYPFYFGHPGFSDAEFLDAVNNIKLFTVDRTIYNFITLPFHFLLSSYRIPMFFAFFTWPLFLIYYIKKKGDKYFGFTLFFLSAYIFLHLVVWFFLATHQIRFLFVPVVVLFLFWGAVSEAILTKILSRLNSKMVFICVLFFMSLLSFKIIKAKDSYFLEVKKTELFYILGKYDKADFYDHRNLGTSYRLSEYINNNYTDSKFLNIWNTNNFFVKNGNQYISPTKMFYIEQFSTTTLLDFIKKEKIKYGLVDNFEKYQSFNEPVRVGSPTMMRYANFATSVEDMMRQSGRKIFDAYGGEIYQFDFVN